MAVKVMVAPAIARGEIERDVPARERAATATGKPRRRRSAVYDGDGNEVFITLMCLKCHRMRPLSLFGLRRMADGSIRNQPWCRSCRSGAEKQGNGKPAGTVAAEDSPLAEASHEAAPPRAAAGREPRRGNVAAEVAAALAAGRG
jgi:hypothetical protein